MCNLPHFSSPKSVSVRGWIAVQIAQSHTYNFFTSVYNFPEPINGKGYRDTGQCPAFLHKLCLLSKPTPQSVFKNSGNMHEICINN
jgi:hypothetical protein